MSANLIFHQFFEAESSTYTYLLGDAQSRECVLIDSVIETVERDVQWIHELGLKLMYVLDSHIHADHITAAGVLRKRLGAKTAVSAAANVHCADIALEDQQSLRIGSFELLCLATPGHTDSCMCFYIDGKVFTGDCLMIRGTGRTDFQQGSAERLYKSIHEKLFVLDDATKVYPAHDYKGQCSSTIGLEKQWNPRVGRDKSAADFVKIMAELKLSNPKKLEVAVPANMSCGDTNEKTLQKVEWVDGVPVISPAELIDQKSSVTVIDVRRPEEFNNELGHIEGAQLFTLGQELSAYLKSAPKDHPIVFVCRSGMRSAQATLEALDLKFKTVANMGGGMLRWNQEALPVER